MSTHCVVYRVGGTERFFWTRSFAMSYDAAVKTKAETERMRYRAMIERYNLSVSAGLPETWEYVPPFA